jgi:hypothetical protein
MIAEHARLNPKKIVFASNDFTSAQALVVFAEVCLLAGFTLDAHHSSSGQ